MINSQNEHLYKERIRLLELFSKKKFSIDLLEKISPIIKDLPQPKAEQEAANICDLMERYSEAEILKILDKR